MFGVQEGSDKIAFYLDTPPLEKFKKKLILIMKAKNDRGGAEINDENIANEIIMMEVNRQVLENLYSIC